jgi:hypothetical protein
MAHLGVGIRVFIGLLTVGTAFSQVYPGQYPPGGYPPGGYPPGGYPGGYPYPGGTGGGIPVPGRGRNTKTNPPKETGQPMPNFRGKLKQMDNKSISLELDDHRVMDFRRTDKTKFFKNGDEVKNPKFAAGDQISVEGPEDAQGYLTAVNVYWEKGASGSSASAEKKDDGVQDTWARDNTASARDNAASADPGKKDAKNADAKPAEPARDEPVATRPEASAEVVRPAKPDPEDPGPPRLIRGRAASPSREHAASDPPVAETAEARMPVPETAPAEPPKLRAPRPNPDEDTIPIMRRSDDPLIRRAADAAIDFTEGLPAYVCQEMMSRYESESRPARFQPIDVVSMNVVYENGKEDYRDLAVNGKPAKKSIEEIGGAWSTGEFGTVLIDLFSPATSADFRYSRDSRTSGINAKLYDFSVKRENSHWNISMGSQKYSPPYKGSVWIDPQTARVLRIEMEAYGFPDSFPTDHVESATDYQYIRLGDTKQYLLPVHAETLSCQRGSNFCSKNTIDFRNYHKYSGESSITFGNPKDEVKK